MPQNVVSHITIHWNTRIQKQTCKQTYLGKLLLS